MSAPQPDPQATPLRAVQRAVAELRRGTPVVLLGAEDALLLLAAETASPVAMAEFEAAVTAPVLLLEPARAAAVLHRPVEKAPHALALPGLEPGLLRALADPTQAMPTAAEAARPVPAPADASAALALAKLARLLPALLAGKPRADAISALLAVAAADVLAYPASEAAALARVAEARVPLTAARDARIVSYRAPDAGAEHLAIVIGEPSAEEASLVRLHSECFTGDLLGSLRCDCGDQLRGAIARMAEEGSGVVLYLAQEGRGIGLVNKLRAYALQDQGLDTLDANRALGWGADERSFLIAATMLRDLGITRLRLLTNNPAKVAALAACGIEVAAREAIVIPANGVNDAYLATKAARFGHLLDK